MRGVPVTGLARKLEAPASGLPDAKKPAPRPKVRKLAPQGGVEGGLRTFHWCSGVFFSVRKGSQGKPDAKRLMLRGW